jgi:4-amino-4-deoxy-L-arabinose transferase-like glycosyltransferase
MRLPSFLKMVSYASRKHISIIFFLFLFTTLVRFPFLFQANLDWDEATYIIMGQSLLDGNLPYIQYWEIKPPLAFLPYAFFIWFFGHSIIGIRLGAALCVLISGYIIYLIGNHLWGKLTGFLAAIIFIFFSSRLYGQPLMPESIACIPVTIALALITMREDGSQTSFLVGLAISIATLVRLNFAYLALFIGGFYFIGSCIKPNYPIRNLIFYILGGIIPALLVIFPYVIYGHWKIFLDSAIITPWQYANAQHSTAQPIHLVELFFTIRNVLLCIGIIGGIIVMIKKWGLYTKGQKHGISLLCVFLMAVIISILSGGIIFSHHLLQLWPFIALLSGYFFAFLYSKGNKFVSISLLLVGFTISSPHLLTAFHQIGSKIWNSKPFKSDKIYQIADYLRVNNPMHEPIYLMDSHIIYWLTNTKPISRLAHPANITQDLFIKLIDGPQATPENQMIKLLQKKPIYIIKRANLWYLIKEPAVRTVLNDVLKSSYTIEKIIEGEFIYKRNRTNN